MQENLPAELSDADTKTIDRLMKELHQEGKVSDAITVEVQAAKSRRGIAQQRKIQVFTAYGSEV